MRTNYCLDVMQSRWSSSATALSLEGMFWIANGGPTESPYPQGAIWFPRAVMSATGAAGDFDHHKHGCDNFRVIIHTFPGSATRRHDAAVARFVSFGRIIPNNVCFPSGNSFPPGKVRLCKHCSATRCCDRVPGKGISTENRRHIVHFGNEANWMRVWKITFSGGGGGPAFKSIFRRPPSPKLLQCTFGDIREDLTRSIYVIAQMAQCGKLRRVRNGFKCNSVAGNDRNGSERERLSRVQSSARSSTVRHNPRPRTSFGESVAFVIVIIFPLVLLLSFFIFVS